MLAPDGSQAAGLREFCPATLKHQGTATSLPSLGFSHQAPPFKSINVQVGQEADKAFEGQAWRKPQGNNFHVNRSS